jgi:two-component system chemotaxis sensor kinase CheA
MRRYLELFVSEAREHLEEAAEAISRLENQPGDAEILNLLFRHGHSIKGMAASMGFDPIARLSHALEDGFDDIRKGRAVFTPELAVQALKAIDLLGEAVDAVARGEEPPASLLELAAALRTGGGGAAGGPSPAPAAAGSAPPAPQAPPAAATAAGVVYNAEITLAPDSPMPAARALVLYKRLEGLGQILFSAPDKAAIAAGHFEGRMLVQFTSTSTERRLRQELDGIPEVRSVVVTLASAAGESPAEARGGGAAPAPANAAAGPTLRIRTDALDRVLDHLGELIIHESRLENALAPGPGGRAKDALEAMRKTLERLRGDLLGLRMVPFEHVAPRFVRSVRNLGGNLGKRVTLAIHGREVSLDRAILEDLVDPINHILRNAVDHGIESPAERALAGKDPLGRILIRNTQYAESATIEIEDDGRGMDAGRIRQTAVARGFLGADEARALSDSEALMLVTIPGFSTAATLTEVSGRGVGMDVVRTRVESLGGRLRIFSAPGRGTRILLRLPLTMAVINAFLVRSGPRVFAVPVRNIRRTFEAVTSEIRQVAGVPIQQVGDETVELLYLSEAMGDPPAADRNGGPRSHPALLYRRHDRPTGLVVDAVLGKRDVVVKPLRAPLEHLREYAGATILEDGRIALILDVQNLSR